MNTRIFVLIIACLLVAMPLSAVAFGQPMEIAQDFNSRETKIIVKGEVTTGLGCEILAPLPYLKQKLSDTYKCNGMVAERPYNLSSKNSPNGKERWPRFCGIG